MEIDRKEKDVKKNKYRVEHIRKALSDFVAGKEFTGYPHEDFFFESKKGQD